jgi:hypothetical protein
MKKKVESTEEQLLDPCPLVSLFDTKQRGLFRLKGMCFVLDYFPELRKTCPTCQSYKDIPPNSYSCTRFYCTQDKVS